MKIELKNIKTNLAFSEETTMFTAYIHIDGKCVGYASNDGRGGSTYYQAIEPYEKNRELISQAEEYCKNLPPLSFKNNGETHELKMDLELYIDGLVEDSIIVKQHARDFKKGICISKGSKSNYQISYWKGWDIPKMLSTPQGKQKIKESIAKFKADGYVILNTNLGDIEI